MFDLTPEQLTAYKESVNLLSSCPYATLGGYAGTGKTTLISHVIHNHPGAKVCAYTGKASDVLRRKGVEAQTIHSLMYELMKDEDGKPILSPLSQLQWEKKPTLDASLIIVDEASMVPEWIHEDLMSYGIPLLYVGDHGQLPPVGDDFNLMEDPDIKLETVHRNAGEIEQFANFLREYNNPEDWITTEGKVHIGDFHNSSVDQVICGFNKTRHAINKEIREKKGHSSPFQKGEKIIVLQNDRKIKVFNGMIGEVISLDKYNLTFSSHSNTYTVPIYLSSPEKKSNMATIPVGYAYCITCHKAQGDEYDILGVIEEQCDYWEPERWNYTAASRAKKALYWSPLT